MVLPFVGFAPAFDRHQCLLILRAALLVGSMRSRSIGQVSIWLGVNTRSMGGSLGAVQTCRCTLGDASVRTRNRDVVENESAREGYPTGADFR
jgi:hypothetical protein